MRIPYSKWYLFVVACFVLITILVVVPSLAQQKMKIAGVSTAAEHTQKVMPIGDSENHFCSLTLSEGSNVSTGENPFMDGGQMINMGFTDVNNGTGTMRGYGHFTTGDDKVFFKWSGKSSTTIPESGMPMTTFEGDFSYTSGAGQYENIKGGGTFEGNYISERIYVVNWEAEYYISK